VGEDAVVVVGASRPYPGETANGDAWAVHYHAGGCRIALVDGLGHGPEAAAAADAAIAVLAAHPALDPVAAIQACHGALAGTRGAVVVVAHVDPAARRLTVAGVGNAEIRLRQSGHEQRPISYRGVVGGTIGTVRAFVLDLDPDWLLLMHTDGVNARLDLEPTAALPPDALGAGAEALLRRWASEDDDATVVLAVPVRDAAVIAESARLPG
jgi:serine phosphatase RsbU (regulator of sigma subunit)